MLPRPINSSLNTNATGFCWTINKASKELWESSATAGPANLGAIPNRCAIYWKFTVPCPPTLTRGWMQSKMRYYRMRGNSCEKNWTRSGRGPRKGRVCFGQNWTRERERVRAELEKKWERAQTRERNSIQETIKRLEEGR